MNQVKEQKNNQRTDFIISDIIKFVKFRGHFFNDKKRTFCFMKPTKKRLADLTEGCTQESY
jgi:hypothetical protein